MLKLINLELYNIVNTQFLGLLSEGQLAVCIALLLTMDDDNLPETKKETS